MDAFVDKKKPRNITVRQREDNRVDHYSKIVHVFDSFNSLQFKKKKKSLIIFFSFFVILLSAVMSMRLKS